MTALQEGEPKGSDHSKQTKLQKGQVKNKNRKPAGPKIALGNSVNKNKDGKDVEAISAVTNGSIASNAQPRKTVISRSSSEQKVVFLIIELDIRAMNFLFRYFVDVKVQIIYL